MLPAVAGLQRWACLELTTLLLLQLLTLNRRAPQNRVLKIQEVQEVTLWLSRLESLSGRRHAFKQLSRLSGLKIRSIHSLTFNSAGSSFRRTVLFLWWTTQSSPDSSSFSALVPVFPLVRLFQVLYWIRCTMLSSSGQLVRWRENTARCALTAGRASRPNQLLGFP